MTLQILVENTEAFAKLNYLRDSAIDDEIGSWEQEKQVYLAEAACTEAKNYVLTNEELDLMMLKQGLKA
jgi:hypothetical protein